MTVQYTGPACLTCGCEEQVHHHYRPGLDCGRCGSDRCPVYDTSARRLRGFIFDTVCMLIALAAAWALIFYLQGGHL